MCHLTSNSNHDEYIWRWLSLVDLTRIYTLVSLSLVDLTRMYTLVSRVRDGLVELRTLLEKHIYTQGLAAIEKCGEGALNVCNNNN